MKLSLPVSITKLEDLYLRMSRLGVAEGDLSEEFVLGSGAGGQKINKTSSAVQLTHRPSGLQVKCQQSRSQGLNRYLARRLLVEKMEEKALGEQSARQQQIEKIRRQKRKRSRRAKDKMLDGKRLQGMKKNYRKKPDRDA